MVQSSNSFFLLQKLHVRFVKLKWLNPSSFLSFFLSAAKLNVKWIKLEWITALGRLLLDWLKLAQSLVVFFAYFETICVQICRMVFPHWMEPVSYSHIHFLQIQYMHHAMLWVDSVHLTIGSSSGLKQGEAFLLLLGVSYKTAILSPV